MEPSPDVIILSDLHLGRGLNPETRRYHGLEAFFYDADLCAFVAFLCEDARARRTAFKLVLNGDIFDFLRIEPSAADAQSSSATERRYGPMASPHHAAATMAEVLAGHPLFVEALATALLEGNEVVVLPGNHDVEVQWPEVQEPLRAALRARLLERGGDEEAQRTLSRLGFHPWFFHEPGRVWVEHGCQYDPENAFKYPLRRAFTALADPTAALERDLPLGNFFQKYLYNLFGSLTFIVPTAKANWRYFKWLLLNQPRLLIGVLAGHLPFLFLFARRMARLLTPDEERMAKGHAEELEELAAGSGLGEKLSRIDGFKAQHADAATAAGEILKQSAQLGGLGLLATFFTLVIWTGLRDTIDFITVNHWWSTLLRAMVDFFFVIGLGAAGLRFLLRSSATPSPAPHRMAAQRIAETLDVPFVVFGHTHEEGLWPLVRPDGGRGWYLNPGTWIAVFTHDVLLPRETVEFGFVRVRGDDAELLRWSPARRTPLPVVLLDEGA
jgi:UDP-2,3-diacylglucosamine pyrophosphatase LpxH